MQKFYPLFLILIFSITCFNKIVNAQLIQCDATELQDFYNLYGGTSSFSTHSNDAVNAFIETEDAIIAGNYTQANSLVNAIFNTYSRGNSIWWNVFNDPNGANLGTPHAYYGLRMMEDIIDYQINVIPPTNPLTAKMKVVLVGCSEGIQPTTETQLNNGTGPFVTNSLDPNLMADDYCVINQSLHLFTQYITAITRGHLVLEVEFVELPNVCMDVNVSTTDPHVASGGVQPVWDALSDEVKDGTDWWWVLYPSHVPDFPTFDDEAFITGGMGADSKGGPVFIIDDKWLTRKPPHLGDGDYNDIERRIYLPQWLQHEFFHHLYRIYPEFNLEVNGHDWFDISTWPSDFEGQFEPDYYAESLHKRLQTACKSLATKLITRKTDALQPYYDALVMDDLVGSYSLDNVQNDWHVGEIILIGGNYFWRNSANVQWSVTPNLSEGKLETGADCPYPGQDFFIEFYQNSEGDFVPGISELRFQADSYKKRFNLLRESVPLEIALGLHESKCLDSLIDSGNLIKEAGQYSWQNDMGQSWSLTPDVDNERFTLNADSPTPDESFELVVVENECGIADLGFKYLNNYYWQPKRDEQNPSPTLANPISNIVLQENFGTHQIDISNVFEDVDGEELFLFATSSDPNFVTTEIANQQLILTGNHTGNITILIMALDFNGGLVMHKFDIELTVSNNNVERNEDSFSIFPNPTRDYVSIVSSSSDYSVSLYSINQEVLQEYNQSTSDILQLDISALAEGIYFILLTDLNTGKVKMEKLVKY